MNQSSVSTSPARLLLILAGLNLASTASADGFSPDFSLILDGHYKSANSALSESEKGFGLGHVEGSISSAIDDLFYGKFTGVLHQHDDKTEFEAEEAFIQTLALPGGFTIRAGRFLSDIGYLNNQHSHTDSFTERPAVYRALLGSHYYDDGARLNYVMPTDLYWTIGTEAFGGRKMRTTGLDDPKSVGVYTAYSKIGGDIGLEHSWQLGLSYLRNENGAGVATKEGHEENRHGHHHHHDGHDHGHGHCHNAQFTGKNLYSAEAVWKWAPDGNYKYRNLSLSGEYIQARDIHQTIGKNKHHDGWYLSSVYQMNSQWAAGARYGEFKGYEAHGDHFHEKRLNETDLSLSWSHSHFSVVRLQFTHQQGDGFEKISNNTITLQYVMSLGAHDAHSF